MTTYHFNHSKNYLFHSETTLRLLCANKIRREEECGAAHKNSTASQRYGKAGGNFNLDTLHNEITYTLLLA